MPRNICKWLKTDYRHFEKNNDLIITNSFMFKVTILITMNSFKLAVIVISYFGSPVVVQQ